MIHLADISIVSAQMQTCDSSVSEDCIETRVSGAYHCQEEIVSICYNEQASSGLAGSRTVLQIDKGKQITLTRTGLNNTEMIFKEGHCSHCNYNIGTLSTTLCISDVLIRSDFTPLGGKLELTYDLEAGSAKIGRIYLTLTVVVKEALSIDDKPHKRD